MRLSLSDSVAGKMHRNAIIIRAIQYIVWAFQCIFSALLCGNDYSIRLISFVFFTGKVPFIYCTFILETVQDIFHHLYEYEGHPQSKFPYFFKKEFTLSETYLLVTSTEMFQLFLNIDITRLETFVVTWDQFLYPSVVEHWRQ